MKYPYRFLLPAVLLSSLLALSACGINTKFDDADYRPVGASTPLNSETHTLEETRPQVHIVKEENPNTRYVKPGEETTALATKPAKSMEKTATASSPALHNASNKKVIYRETSQGKQSNKNILTRTINQLLNHRYGSADTILKISRTVQIHCDIKPIKNKQQSNTDFELCRYQFPDICGAHQFSVIFNKDKQLLMYMDRKYQRNIIDTLSGSKGSSPGLWDDDDYVSSELLTVGQLLNKSSDSTSELGWIVETSNNEKAQLGRSYYAAIKEASKCF